MIRSAALIVLAAMPAGAVAQSAVQGIITTDRGRPIAGAEILIEAQSTRTTTDASGEFEIAAPPGTRVLTIRAIGYQAAIVTVVDPTNIDGFTPRELEGVEIYRGTAEAPAQYSGLDHHCGVILLWTRDH